MRDSAGHVIKRTMRGSIWSGWTSLGGSIVGGPAAVAINSTTTAVYVTAVDNHVYRRTVTDTGQVSGWESLGGLATSRPGVTNTPNGTESMVIRGTGAEVYLRQRVGGQWGPWQSLGGLLVPLGPSAAVTANGALSVAVVGIDNALYVKTRSPTGTWSSRGRVGGLTNADTAFSPTADMARLVTVFRGSDQAGWFVVGDATATSWTDGVTIGGALASGPTVTVNGSALEVFAVAVDDRLYRKTAANGATVTGWTGWQLVP